MNLYELRDQCTTIIEDNLRTGYAQWNDKPVGIRLKTPKGKEVPIDVQFLISTGYHGDSARYGTVVGAEADLTPKKAARKK